MRKEFDIETELRGVLGMYHDKVAELTIGVIAQVNQRVKELREELQEVLTFGATLCVCAVPPMGIHQPSFYEVGCSNDRCKEMRFRQSRGATIDEAVKNWNDGVYFKRPGR